MLITALRCPVLKPMRWGKGLSGGTTIHFVSKQGWAWHLMQFFTNDLRVNMSTCKTNDAIASLIC